MSSNTFIAYNGTSVENYRTCANVCDEGIFFDKLKEPRHFHKELYFEETLVRAVAQSIHHARKVGHSPLVLEGKIYLFYRRMPHMMQGDVFPVDKVWVPKSSIRLPEIDLKPFWNGEADPEEYYEPVDPAELLG